MMIIEDQGHFDKVRQFARSVLAAEVITREGIQGEQRAIDTNEAVGARVRKVIEESGSPLPEDLPVEPPINQIETRVKAGNKLPKAT